MLITNTRSDTGGDGDYDELYAFGSHSLSIWDVSGNLVYDSGSMLEQITVAILPEYFNATNDANDFNDRSDSKGPEPEGVTAGMIDGRVYAFIGLERVGGIVTVDVTEPSNPKYYLQVNAKLRNETGCFWPQISSKPGLDSWRFPRESIQPHLLGYYLSVSGSLSSFEGR